MSGSLRSYVSVDIRWRFLAIASLFILYLPTSASSMAVAHADTVKVPCATNSQGQPMSFNPDNPYICWITMTTNADGSEDVRIDQPVVSQPSFEYQSIVFSPGDLVTLTADGCVQTAGIGSTWKKYVNPSGSDSGPPNGYYFGTIKIKGATWSHGLLEEGTPLDYLTLPDTNPAEQLFVPSVQNYPGSSHIDLTLGYVDQQGKYDDHGGNGYWGHDSGNNDQCANTDPGAPLGQYGGNAWVNLHIVHDQSNPFGNVPVKDWDLVQNGLDANGLAMNPEWGWQINGGFITNQGVYDASCFPGCTQQITSYDKPEQHWYNVAQHILFNVCHLDTGLSGHHNWFDATYNGTVNWVTHDGPAIGDDDYNMRLLTPTFHADPAGTTFFNGSAFDNAAETDIGLEFDSDETIDKYDQNLFWNVFHQTVDHQGDGAAGGIINGHDAVAVGLMGIDEVHEGYTEMHPVHALAIRESAPGSPDPAHDYWAFFVRNWGDEGECSSRQHYLLDNQVTLQLTPPSGQAATTASLNGDTQVLQSGTDAKYSFYSGPQGTFVTFDLPSGDSQGYQFGEIDLNWNGMHQLMQGQRPAHTSAAHRAWLRSLIRSLAHTHHGGNPHLVPSKRTASDSQGEPEAQLAAIWNSFTPAQQQTYHNLLALLSPSQPVPPSSASQLLMLNSPPQRPASVPGIADAPATAKVERDVNRFQAMCAAAGGNLPTQPTWCADVNLPPVTTLTTTGGPPVVSGWYTTPVTATLTAYDASGSGIASTQFSYDSQNWTTYSGPFVLPDGIYTFYYRSTDNKGNVEQTRQQAFKIDTLPPVISIIQPAPTDYTHSSSLTLNYGVTDGATTGVGAGSGVQSYTPTMDGATTLGGHGLANGQPISLLTEMSLGSHTFRIDAVDNVGHADFNTVTFNIIVTPESIKDDVRQFLAMGDITNAGLANSLLAKLNAAANARAGGNCSTADNIYNAFINELQAQSGKGVDSTAAQIMIGDAQYLIGHCP